MQRCELKNQGVPFNLEIEDVLIPKRCPVFGFILKTNTGAPRDNSPNLDKIIPDKGYVKGNTWVISAKANRAKANLSLRELKRLVRALERKINGKPS